MAVIARCPHCDTSFRVTPKQMKAKSGKVRCGSCKAVFNVLEHLVEESTDPATPKLALQWPEEINRALGEATQPPAAGRAEEDAPRDPDTPVAETSPTDAPEAAGAQATPEAAPEPALSATDLSPPVADRPGTGDEASGFAAREIRAAPGYNRWAEAPLSSGGITISPPGSTMSPSARVMWPVIGIVAAIALVFQAAYHWRTELAARLPAATPFLEALCVQFRCTIGLPRDATTVTIDTSTLQTDPARPGVVMLDAILRNSAAHLQALPNLELTLTDGADRPISRRTLEPADYLSGSETEIRERIAAGFAPQSELGVRLWLDVSQLGAAGYRLYLFYP